VVDAESTKWWRTGFDSLVEAMRYLLLCLYVHARLARQADGSWG
jgi:hypothetical protein